MIAPPLDRMKWPVVALAASLGALATAHAAERFGHLAPCPLCYTQRQVYWAAAGLALLAVIVTWRGVSSRSLFALNLMLGLVFLTSAGVASYHALVEWGVLAAPDTCAAGDQQIEAGASLWDQLAKPQAIPSCADAAWRMFGLSMAGWNVLASLALASLSFLSAVRPIRTDTANEVPPIS